MRDWGGVRIDLSPLLRGERGETIRVAGVRVGDPAASVDRGALTGAEDDDPIEPRTYREGSVYRTGPDGMTVEIALAERVEATVRGSGFLRCGEVALRVTEGVIERIFVRGPSLASLRIARETDLEARFGPAAWQEPRLGWRLHHYPARGLVIAWHADEDRVEHVALGEEPRPEPRLGARELLSEILHAYGVLPPVDWAEPAGGSARVRYLRIAALARALGLGAVPELVQGAFLEGAPSAGRRAVLEEIAASSGLPGAAPRRPVADLLFGHLLRYRHDVDRVVRASSGWLECSDHVLLGMILTQQRLGERIEAMMADVDHWLCTLMDPAHRTFTVRDLIAHHGWPDVDLHELEMEEL